MCLAQELGLVGKQKYYILRKNMLLSKIFILFLIRSVCSFWLPFWLRVLRCLFNSSLKFWVFFHTTTFLLSALLSSYVGSLANIPYHIGRSMSHQNSVLFFCNSNDFFSSDSSYSAYHLKRICLTLHACSFSGVEFFC